MGFEDILKAQGVAVDKKRCPRCGEYKSPHEFHKNRRKSDGLACHCRECEKTYKLLFGAKTKKHVDNKRCSQCKTVKPRDAFHRDRYKSDGLTSACKLCIMNARGSRAMQTPNIPSTKRCLQCGQVKPWTEYHRSRHRAEGIVERCKECRAVERQVAYARKVARETVPPTRAPDLGSWEQVDSAVREMAELQAEINYVKMRAQEMIVRIRSETAEAIIGAGRQQARLHVMVARFIKLTRRDSAPLHRMCRFGSVHFVRRNLDIRLDSDLAAQYKGKP